MLFPLNAKRSRTGAAERAPKQAEGNSEGSQKKKRKENNKENYVSFWLTHRQARGISGIDWRNVSFRFCVRFSGNVWLNFSLTPYFGTSKFVELSWCTSPFSPFTLSADASFTNPFEFSILISFSFTFLQSLFAKSSHKLSQLSERQLRLSVVDLNSNQEFTPKISLELQEWPTPEITGEKLSRRNPTERISCQSSTEPRKCFERKCSCCAAVVCESSLFASLNTYITSSEAGHNVTCCMTCVFRLSSLLSLSKLSQKVYYMYRTIFVGDSEKCRICNGTMKINCSFGKELGL